MALLRAGFFPFPSAIKLDSQQPCGMNRYPCVRVGHHGQGGAELVSKVVSAYQAEPERERGSAGG